MRITSRVTVTAAPLGTKLKVAAGVVGAQVEWREIAIAVDRNGSGYGGIESCGRLSDRRCIDIGPGPLTCRGRRRISKSGRVMVPSAVPVADDVV